MYSSLRIVFGYIREADLITGCNVFPEEKKIIFYSDQPEKLYHSVKKHLKRIVFTYKELDTGGILEIDGHQILFYYSMPDMTDCDIKFGGFSYEDYIPARIYNDDSSSSSNEKETLPEKYKMSIKKIAKSKSHEDSEDDLPIRIRNRQEKKKRKTPRKRA